MAFELRAADGNSFAIDGELVKVGRAKDNTIVLNDNAVSRYHLNFYIQNGGLVVEDAGSQNGYFVNGQNIKGSVKLSAGDRIGIGSKEYLVQVAGPIPLALERVSGVNTRNVQIGSPHLNSGQAMNRSFAAPAYSSTSSQDSSSGRIKIYGALAILFAIGAVVMRSKEIANPRKPASTPTNPVAPPLPYEREEKFRQKGITEVQAEAKFREALRDYYNKNYSRAILVFKEVLTLNSNHEEARKNLQTSEDLLTKNIKELIDDSEKSLANLQFGRAKAQSMRVLTLIAEQIPSYGRKIAEDSARALPVTSVSQDENLLTVPCDKYKTPDLCTRAQKLLKEARQKIGDEDTLREVK